MTPHSQRKDYIGLRSIRGIGAILIFYHHFGFDSPVTDSFGDFAVSLFFMLSGLVLSMSYSDLSSECNEWVIGRFMKKRILKIYPVYLLSLAAAIIVKGCRWSALPFDLLLLQSWIPQAGFYFSGNSVSWFVSSLFFAYLLFLPLRKAMTADTGRFTVMFGCLLIPYFLICAFIPVPLVKGIIYINPVMELPAFVIGMLIWRCFGHRDGRQTYSDRAILCLQTIALLLSSAFIYLFRYVDPRWSLASYWWVPNAFLLTVTLMAEGRRTPFNRVLGLRIMQGIGDISFTFYLFHTIIITLYRNTLTYVQIEIATFPSSLVCLIITLAFSSLMHCHVEIPLAQVLKRKFT